MTESLHRRGFLAALGALAGSAACAAATPAAAQYYQEPPPGHRPRPPRPSYGEPQVVAPQPGYRPRPQRPDYPPPQAYPQHGYRPRPGFVPPGHMRPEPPRRRRQICRWAIDDWGRRVRQCVWGW